MAVVLGWIRRVFRLPLRSVAFDVAAAAIIAGFSGLALLSGHWPTALIGFAMAVALLPRRRWPVPVFTVVCVVGVVQLVVVHTAQAYDVAVVLALYTVVKYADRMAWAWIAGATVVVGSIVYGLTIVDRVHLGGWYRPTAMLLAVAIPVWLAGLAMRTRRLYVRSLEERALAAEQERDQRARLAVADERSRIARELHDVVAHSLAVMIAQADGATYALAGDPATARDAVRTVADTGRGALSEMRRLVAVLRDHGVDDAIADRRTERLSDVTLLLDGFRRAGLQIAVATSGRTRPLPHGLELAAYRIVQESLTNVLRHAPGAQAVVTVNFSAATLHLTVDDSPPPESTPDHHATPQPHGGSGITGMIERAQALGGDLTAGPRADGGFRVHARLPIPDLDTDSRDTP